MYQQNIEAKPKGKEKQLHNKRLRRDGKRWVRDALNETQGADVETEEEDSQ